MKKTLLLLAMAMVVSCGGGSGVDGDKYADELSEEEARSLCEWGIEEQGGVQEKDCGNMLSVSIKAVDTCVSQTRPHCKVSVYEDCIGSLGGDPCKIFTNTECAAFLMCGVGQ
jgi:hypothetical protein